MHEDIYLDRLFAPGMQDLAPVRMQHRFGPGRMWFCCRSCSRWAHSLVFVSWNIWNARGMFGSLGLQIVAMSLLQP